MLYTHHFHCSTGQWWWIWKINIKSKMSSPQLQLRRMFRFKNITVLLKSVILQKIILLYPQRQKKRSYDMAGDEMKPRRQQRGMRKPHRAAWLYASLLSNFLQVQTHPQSYRECAFIYNPNTPFKCPPFYLLDIQWWNKQKMFQNEKAGQNWPKGPFTR